MVVKREQGGFLPNTLHCYPKSAPAWALCIQLPSEPNITTSWMMNQFSLVVEWFSVECRKSKAIAMANHKSGKQSSEDSKKIHIIGVKYGKLKPT